MAKQHKFAYWIITAIICILIIFSFNSYFKARTLENTVTNNYNRAFHELVNYVDDIDTLLEKSMLVSGAAQLSTISSELFRQTTAAKACLGQLPISEAHLENTEKFLSQIGDYTYYLSQNVINKKEISDDDYQTLTDLSGYASNLNNSLLKMQEDIYSGNIKFEAFNKKSQKYLNNTVSADSSDILSDFESVEKEFQEYPSLIYDGPFSNHIEGLKPKLLDNETEITSDEGLKKAKELLPEFSDSLSYCGESQNTAISAYSYSCTTDLGDVFVSISKKGGYPIYFLNSRNVDNKKITYRDAVNYARDFLSSKGYTSMRESYYDTNSNIATINFAYTQSGVVCYSDLIKIKVAMDNGEIIGMEANGYIMNHCHRDTASVSLSSNEALAYVNNHLSIDSTALALIPTDSKKEVLCYEFKGSHNGRNFLIYINASTGAEEKILMLIESDSGILTI